MEMRGATAADAVENYRRRAGCDDSSYTCTSCRRRTSAEYDTLGNDCLCGGRIVRLSTYRLLAAEIGE
jgi:DNA-directed RNA polymerase subunit RPC12/RpoP